MEYLAALLPSAGLAVLFVLLMRSILHADRRERAAAARARAERRAAGESAPKDRAS
ncbi:hypothetical protein [Kineococcus aurantiacus]|uniref:Heme exporter protein D n=1 Tax=Kineococcus aurantiacus TaxID=37633 RepID=A0A7Y9DKB0_9ACTN|nr:hypothetical protein [Kineococcus aurantiacus]NYD22153.1 hypothetical protein [Kineococcus aurantiacus]